MPDPNRAILDAAVKRRIALERYSSSQVKQALQFLKEVERDLIGRIAVIKSEATTRSGRILLAQQEQLLKSVQSVYAEAYARLTGELTGNMRTLAGIEADHASGMLSRAVDRSGANVAITTQTLTATEAFEIAAARPMNGAVLKDWLADLEPSHRRRVEQALKISFTEGENLNAAVSRLRGATALNQRGLETLIRTSTTHIAAAVNEATYKANTDVIQEVEWVSVLDGRTTDVCRARDGQRYPVGEGPRPPAHAGCRSTTISVLKEFEPPPRENYGEWLARQDAATQDDILGPARGRLFRAGKFTVDRFVDMKGKALTLSELGSSRAGVSFGKSATDLFSQAANGDISASAFRKELAKHVEVTGKVKRLSMPAAERLSKVKLGGVDVWLPADLSITPTTIRDLNAVLNNANAAATELKTATSRVTLAKGRSVDDAFWAEQFGHEGFETAASALNGEVVFFGGRRVTSSTLTHEMGHNWAEKLYGSSEIPSSSPFAKLVASGVEAPPSWYAGYSLDEDWAETVSLFVTRPAKLQSVAPKRFAIVSALLKR